MLSRRYAWLLLAVPAALILLWAALSTANSNSEEQTEALDLQGQLIYLSPAGGEASIYAFDSQSGQSTRLSDQQSISAFHAARDGSRLFFAVANQQFGADIWQLNLTTLEESLLIECASQRCDAPQISPDGGHLAYTRLDSESGLPQLLVHDFSTSTDAAISVSGEIALLPQWSQDGRLAYYNQSHHAYVVYAIASDTSEMIANDLGEGLSWAPDSTVFVAAEAFPADSEILRGTTGEASLQTPEPDSLSALEITVTALIRYGDGSPEALFTTDGEAIEDAAPVFSPNGRWLAFTRKYLDEERWTPGRQLWIHELESGATLPLTAEGSYQMSNLSWNSDSSAFAFVRSNRTDFNQPVELWVMLPSGSGAQLVAIDGFAPQWLP